MKKQFIFLLILSSGFHCGPLMKHEEVIQKRTGAGAVSGDGTAKEKEKPTVVPKIEKKPREKPEDETKPTPPKISLFGIGVTWGSWLKLPDDQAKKFDLASLDKIVDAGGNATKVNLAWWDIENKQGVWTWDYVDHQVAEAHKRGLEIYAYVGLTPDWALPAGILAKYGSGIGYRFPPDPAYEAAFTNFMATVAKRYKGKVRNYIFWNEPNGCSWINDSCGNGGTAASYLPWLRLAYKAIKSEDPTAWVSIGGLDAHTGVTNPEKYLEDLYAAGGKDAFDAVTVHPYGQPLNWSAVRAFRQVLERNGDSQKLLWIGEYGWKDISEDDKAKYIKEVHKVLQTEEFSYITMATYLVISDLPGTPDSGRDYGLCSRDLSSLTLSPRPSWQAFKDTAKP